MRKIASFEVLCLLAVLALTAVGARYYQHTVIPDKADGFTFQLQDVNGQTASYRPQDGRLCILLTAIGCAECRQRLPLDASVVADLQKRNIPVWKILVYADLQAGRQFQEQFHAAGDHVLVDPQGAVSVQQLGGSDGTCWMVLDHGTVAWRGPGTPANVHQFTDPSLPLTR